MHFQSLTRIHPGVPGRRWRAELETSVANHPLLLKLGFPLLATTAALSLAVVLAPYADGPVLVFFVLAVALSAWAAGTLAAGVAMALSLLEAAYLLLAPAHVFRVGPAGQLVRVAIQCVVAIVIVIILARLKAAQDRNQYLGAMVESSDDAIIAKDLRGTIRSWNRGAERLYGYTAAEMLGRPMSILMPPDRPDEIGDILQRLSNGEHPEQYEAVRRRKDGMLVEVAVKLSPIVDRGGKIIGASSIAHDITARKQAEQALRRVEESANRVLESVTDGFHVIDAAGRFTRFNSTARQIYASHGVDVDAALGKNIFDVFPHMRNTAGGRALTRALQERVPGFVETYDAPWQSWFAVRLFPTPDGGVATFFLDVTERKLREEALAQAKQLAETSMAQLRTVLDNLAEPVYVCDAGGKPLLTNPAFLKMTGMAAESMPHDYADIVAEFPLFEIDGTPVPFEDRPVSVALRGEQVSGRELRMARPGGDLILRYSAAPVRDPLGNIVMAVLSIEDMTVAKKVEEALRQSEQRVRLKLASILSPEGDIGDLELGDVLDVPALQTLFEQFYEFAKIPMAILDVRGRVLVGVGWQDICTKFHRTNPESCQFCIESDCELTRDVAPGEYKLYRCKNNMWDVATPIIVGGKHMGNLFTGQFFFDNEVPDVELFRNQARRFDFDEQAYLAALHRVPRLSHEALANGMKFFMQLADMVSKLSYGHIKLARSQHALIRHEKLASVGRMAATVAHEINNPLAAAMNAIFLASSEPSAGELVRQHLKLAESELERVAHIARQTLGFYRESGKPTAVEVPEIVNGVLDLYAPRFRNKSVSVQRRFRSTASVLAVEGELRQVISNLVANSIDAANGNAILHVRTCGPHADGMVRLTVADTGAGITPENMKRIFEAFFTTKQAVGTGLGLWVTSELVKKHHGRIRVRSRIGKGTVFAIWLPAERRGQNRDAA